MSETAANEKSNWRKLIAKCRKVLRERFNVKRVVVFGSAAGDAPLHEGSDLDLLVEGLTADKFWDAWKVLENEIFGGQVRVDLVRAEEAPKWLLERIAGGKKVSRDPIAQLQEMVERELSHLRRVVGEVKRSLSRLRRPTLRNIRLMSDRLDDFYLGVERILERIIQQLDGQVPSGRERHKELLDVASREKRGIRPAVLDPTLRERLDSFRKFRHLARHRYADELMWFPVMELAKQVPETFARLELALRTFFQNLRAGKGQVDTA